MPLYNKPAPDLVYDLVNEANPTLPIPLSATNVRFGAPSIIASSPWPQNNTSIEISPAPGNSDYVGKRTLSYRRLDLAALFRSMVIQIRKFKSTTGSNNATVMFTVHQLLNDINQQYGLKLTTDDVNDGNITRGPNQEDGQYTSTVTVTTKVGSLGFTGSFQLKWINTKQSLEDMITVVEIPGRLFPAGNDFSGDPKDTLDSAAFGIDISGVIKAEWAAYGGQTSGPYPVSQDAVSIAMTRGLLNLVNQKCGTEYVLSDGAPTYLTKNEFKGATYSIITLPSALYPQLNSTDFNRCMVVVMPSDCPWAVGRLFGHFNYPFV